MFVSIALSSLLIVGSLATPFLDARDVAAVELPASLSDIKFDLANKDGVTFHITAAGIDAECYPPAKDTAEPVASGRIYKCDENPAVTFSYTGENGKLSVWLSNENESFTGSAIISSPISGEVAIKLASLNV
ncbi:hypothetical protein NM208_g4348 [Fusarium decemcellulare]|uniref:Uncharacterized protein n=1 Tax=Fusarium decemcellulare TaxID=57161 RepID=A0ACC1SL57_9HYPO|nr:hypothetical protein NM208_g4348 [Fusarium decemcellulare]